MVPRLPQRWVSTRNASSRRWLRRRANDLVVAVVPVANSLDLKALAAAVGSKKVAMAEPAEAARSSGYVVGGISPIGQRTPLRTVIDSSATSHDTVLVSGGRRGCKSSSVQTILSQSPAQSLLG